MPPETLTAAQLREIPLLQNVPAAACELLQPHVYRLQFSKGARIVAGGSYLDGAYYLLSGTVVRADAGTAIEAGGIFGEDSALSRFPIVTGIDAATDVSCLFIRTAALRAMFDMPELAAFKTAFDRDYKDRVVRDELRRCDLFANVDTPALDALINTAHLVAFKPGKRIAAEGAPCDAFYLVRGGYVQSFLGLLERDPRRFAAGIKTVARDEWQVWQSPSLVRGVGVINLSVTALLRLAAERGVRVAPPGPTVPAELLGETQTSRVPRRV